MAEITLARHSALDRKQRIYSGFTLAAIMDNFVVQVLGKPYGEDFSAQLGGLCGFVYDVRAAGPGQWLLAGQGLDHSSVRTLIAALPEQVYGVDQSHGRTGIKVSGPGAVKMLAKGVAVDLDLSTFAPGSSTNTLIGHISVHLTRTAPEVFDILVLRGFAVSLWEELELLSGEFSV